MQDLLPSLFAQFCSSWKGFYILASSFWKVSSSEDDEEKVEFWVNEVHSESGNDNALISRDKRAASLISSTGQQTQLYRF